MDTENKGVLDYVGDYLGHPVDKATELLQGGYTGVKNVMGDVKSGVLDFAQQGLGIVSDNAKKVLDSTGGALSSVFSSLTLPLLGLGVAAVAFYLITKK